MNYSFFITKNMKSQLAAGKVNGTLPVLYVFLARSGKTIDDVSYVDLDADGDVQSGRRGRRENGDQGREDRLHRRRRRRSRRCIISPPTSPMAASRSRGFLKFCREARAGDAFVKSASYLMHSGGFSTVRDFLLAAQRGAAAGRFRHSGQLFQGRRVGAAAVRPLSRADQPVPGQLSVEAGQAVQAGNREPLDFGAGYRWRPNELNLLLAVKKQAKSAAK